MLGDRGRPRLTGRRRKAREVVDPQPGGLGLVSAEAASMRSMPAIRLGTSCDIWANRWNAAASGPLVDAVGPVVTSRNTTSRMPDRSTDAVDPARRRVVGVLATQGRQQQQDGARVVGEDRGRCPHRGSPLR